VEIEGNIKSTKKSVMRQKKKGDDGNT